MSFSLGSAVGDVAWSPFSATIFAAVTDNGLARVFDLSQNANEPLCEQKITAKGSLTRVAFSPKTDVILVGDDRLGICKVVVSNSCRPQVQISLQTSCTPKLSKISADCETFCFTHQIRKLTRVQIRCTK